MGQHQQGFTIIELMVAAAVVAILAIVAIPMYSSYIARSQTSEAFTLLDAVRVPLHQEYDQHGSWDITVTGTNTVGGKYVSAVTTPSTTVYPNIASPGTTTVLAQFRTSGVHSKIAGKKIHLYFNVISESWSCANGDTANEPTGNAVTANSSAVVGNNGVPNDVLPASCR